jgi:hypothetical protein
MDTPFVQSTYSDDILVRSDIENMRFQPPGHRAGRLSREPSGGCGETPLE